MVSQEEGSASGKPVFRTWSTERGSAFGKPVFRIWSPERGFAVGKPIFQFSAPAWYHHLGIGGGGMLEVDSRARLNVDDQSATLATCVWKRDALP